MNSLNKAISKIMEQFEFEPSPEDNMRSLICLALMIIFLSPIASIADTIDVQIKGIDDGKKTSKQQDYKEAVLFAKREAIERAGVNIKSMTTVKDMMLESDYIETQAEAVLMPGYNILDMGYSVDGIYQVVLTGKVQMETKEPQIKNSNITSTAPPLKITNSLGMEFVYVKPGSFMMGSPANESGRYDDETQHRVTLSKGFYMQTTEVTQGQWRAIMGSSPSKFSNCGEDCPVEQVSWDDVQTFISKLNRKKGGNRYRLPTEAEWEYAARAGSTARFCYGDDEGRLSEYAWYSGNSGDKTHPVAQKQPNAWGLYDMHGNVYEWCQDWYDKNYPSGNVTDPTGPSSGSLRVLCGGSWSSLAEFCRSAIRYGKFSVTRNLYLGFRLVREL
jgi:formylglycine-generating enzyme required for sulfatase activity